MNELGILLVAFGIILVCVGCLMFLDQQTRIYLEEENEEDVY